jgi:hypothetical protein
MALRERLRKRRASTQRFFDPAFFVLVDQAPSSMRTIFAECFCSK